MKFINWVKWFTGVLVKWLYVKVTNKCYYDGTVLYDPSVAGNSKIRECPKCGRLWNT